MFAPPIQRNSDLRRTLQASEIEEYARLEFPHELPQTIAEWAQEPAPEVTIEARPFWRWLRAHWRTPGTSSRNV